MNLEPKFEKLWKSTATKILILTNIFSATGINQADQEFRP
ncbi:Xylan alpha-(1-2)-glucuronosidase [Frankliniella fusca]|uniref:Xylan alpha-(1-2)-glucuronosidase n=1 Tax=Frankliniella fusca TaxID=407009 RepID=A0AAE1I074_9NEOP|nr:Xylan alpha-(1-2)-glucuronosidase [Frankliniella fusca]